MNLVADYYYYSTGYIYIDLSQFPLYEEEIYLTLKSTVGDLDRDIYTQYTQSEEITDDFRLISPFGSVIIITSILLMINI